MGYRKKNHAASRVWRDWLERCRPTLVLSGIPEEAYESQENWWYFLDHAHMSTRNEPHWFSLDILSHGQLITLRGFLEREFAGDDTPFILDLVRSVTKGPGGRGTRPTP
jgi:hypothetical protein